MPASPIEEIVEHQDLFAVGGREEVRVAGAHEQIPVQAEILKHVLAMVRVIPVDAGIAKVNPILERPARRHRFLRHVRDTVEPIVEPHAVPVHRRRKVSAIGETHDDCRSLVHLDQRAGILAVEAEHRRRCARTARAAPARRRASARAPSASRSSSRGRASGVDSSLPRQIRRDVRSQRHQLGRHADARVHRRRRPRAWRARRFARAPCTCSAGGAPGRPQKTGEQEREIVRLHPDARRRAAQHEAAATFGNVGRRFGGDQDEDTIERDAPQRESVPLRTAPSFTTGSSCGVVAQATYAVYGPTDAGSGRSRQIEQDVVLLLAGRRHRDAEWRRRRQQPRGAGRRVRCRIGRQQLDAVEIGVRAAGGDRIGGARLRRRWLGGRGVRRSAAGCSHPAEGDREQDADPRAPGHHRDSSVTEKLQNVVRNFRSAPTGRPKGLHYFRFSNPLSEDGDRDVACIRVAPVDRLRRTVRVGWLPLEWRLTTLFGSATRSLVILPRIAPVTSRYHAG